MHNPGDKIRVLTKDKEYIGLLMPNEETDSLIIKLDNGYNIGIEKENVKKIELMENYKQKTIKKEKIKFDKNKPTITILHTGGTIASKVDYKTGGVIARFEPEELIEMFPEIKKIANINSRLVTNMWSQDMRFSHYNILAKEIEKEIKKGVDGIIITHGTDTLHYSSAALAFILENLPIPVLLVGAQRSSDRGSSDAGVNLINAVYFIVNSNFCEVAICMHENMSDDYCNILPATKTRKLHTSRRDAFKAINAKPFAKVNYLKKDLQMIYHNFKKKSNSRLTLRLFDEKIKVGVIRQHTNMFAEQFLFYKSYDGLVIETTGLGNIPSSYIDNLTLESDRIFKSIKTLIDNNVIVVLSPQTIFGRLRMSVYSNQKQIMRIGVVGDLSDMTTETTFIKLAWLLSNYKKKEVKKLIGKNFRGEINERIMPDEFLD
jgi:glutamyl-tRNA(Gln) amidotransferase subunit D